VWRWVQIPPLYPCESSEATKREPCAWGHNRATLFLRDTNKETWPSRLKESRIYGHDSRGTQTQEWLLWWGRVAVLNDRHIFIWEKVLRKDYDPRAHLKKKYWSLVSRGLTPRWTDWRQTASCKIIPTNSHLEFSWDLEVSLWREDSLTARFEGFMCAIVTMKLL
jgi:hypothetical protein